MQKIYESKWRLYLNKKLQKQTEIQDKYKMQGIIQEIFSVHSNSKEYLFTKIKKLESIGANCIEKLIYTQSAIRSIFFWEIKEKQLLIQNT